MFSTEELAVIVNKMMPPGKKQAVLGTVDNTGLQVIVGLEFDSNVGDWVIQGSFEHKWSNDNIAKVAVLWTPND